MGEREIDPKKGNKVKIVRLSQPLKEYGWCVVRLQGTEKNQSYGLEFPRGGPNSESAKLRASFQEIGRDC